jgi:hypothetical protein
VTATRRSVKLVKYNVSRYRAFHGFRLEPIFITAPAASKNDAQFKSGQNQLKNKQFA